MDAVHIKRAKYERTTQQQLDFYIRFCKAHPELQAGKNCPQSPHAIQNLWDECASNLNSMRGPSRSAAKWKETLAVWKSQLRSRARKRKAELSMTGGGPSNAAVLSDFEQLALQTFGAAAVDGIAEVATLGLPTTPRNFEEQESHRRPALREINGEIALSTSSPASPQQSNAEVPQPILQQRTETENPDATTSRCPRQQVSPRQRKISLEEMYAEVMRNIERRDAREEEMLQLLRDNVDATKKLVEAVNLLKTKFH